MDRKLRISPGMFVNPATGLRYTNWKQMELPFNRNQILIEWMAVYRFKKDRQKKDVSSGMYVFKSTRNE